MSKDTFMAYLPPPATSSHVPLYTPFPPQPYDDDKKDCRPLSDALSPPPPPVKSPLLTSLPLFDAISSLLFSGKRKIKQHHFNFGNLVPRFNVTADGALSRPSIL